MRKATLQKFFTISNLIEDIKDAAEVEKHIELFEWYIQRWVDDKTAMFDFHSKLNHLNDYCTPWIIRTYDVFVGGRKCMHPEHIQMALDELFEQRHTTPTAIKEWHIKFERIHPFWDGNGRVGRMLLAKQYADNRLYLPSIFLGYEDFEEIRQRYYRWFTK